MHLEQAHKALPFIGGISLHGHFFVYEAVSSTKVGDV